MKYAKATLEDHELIKELSHLMNTSYYMPREYIKYLSKYFTRHWNARHLSRLIKRGNGALYYEGVLYRVVYDPNINICKLHDPKLDTHVKCSLRGAVDFKLSPVVIVKLNLGHS